MLVSKSAVPDFVMSGLFVGSTNFDLVILSLALLGSCTRSLPSVLAGAVVYGWKQSLPYAVSFVVPLDISDQECLIWLDTSVIVSV